MLLAVEAKNLKKTFNTKQGNVEAVRDVSFKVNKGCLLYTSPSPRDDATSRMPSSA